MSIFIQDFSSYNEDFPYFRYFFAFWVIFINFLNYLGWVDRVVWYKGFIEGCDLE